MSSEKLLSKKLLLWQEYSQSKMEIENFSLKVNINGENIDTDSKTKPLELFKNMKFLAVKIDDKIVKDCWLSFAEIYEDLGFEKDYCCKIEPLTFDSDEGKKVFWHSSAHILGQALEQLYDFKLSSGPPLEDGGFFYEGSTGVDNKDINFQDIQTKVNKIIKEKQPFERIKINKEDALKIFEDNKYKTYFINNFVKDGDKVTIYRCGDLVDLCRGPHVPNTGIIKCLQVKNSLSSSYFLGDKNNEGLIRIYGISFPDKNQMKEYKLMLEEAEKRNHLRIGVEQELFMFNPLSPGSCFFLPNGSIIYENLMNFIKNEYWERGFVEVKTPNIAKKELWEISGHWQKYKENMFCFKDKLDDNNEHDNKDDNEEEQKDNMYGLKAMNCPMHCLMFKVRTRSYKELPLRLADFGALHRNEMSGALHGLVRVRKFCQDDSHIFCRVDQIESEIKNCLEFLDYVYKIFGFDYSLELSTRPEQYIGSIEVWDKAEKVLENCLNTYAKGKWKLDPGEGSFYGPKIDIHIQDALKRKHQCATIQLDFNLPERFELSYINEEDKEVRPVIIHRAIFGSFERFIGILIEHYGGKYPFWLSPFQVAIIPVSNKFNQYSEEVRRILHKERFHVKLFDSDSESLMKKVKKSQLQKYCYTIILGQKEQDNKSVNIRYSDKEQIEKSLEEFIEELHKLD